MEKILYFDCFSGISGDMTLGAMVDLGVNKDYLQTELAKLNLEGYEIETRIKQVKGISATDFHVHLREKKNEIENSSHSHGDHHHKDQGHHHHDGDKHHEHHHHHHHKEDSTGHHHHVNFKYIKDMIEVSELNSNVKKLSIKIFKEVALAEGKIHGKPMEEVHFHEVGAVDSIVDIVGAAIAIDWLAPDLIISSPIPLGRGFVKCQHGSMPVPAPATLEILKDIPVFASGINSEITTPTGAAIIKSLVDEFIPLPEMIIKHIGYGAGKKELEKPNLLRLVMGEKVNSPSTGEEKLMMLETNIDDMIPEIYSHLIPEIMNRGALDVYLTNIMMKKNRPAVKINILCKEENHHIFEDLLFKETTTLGVRKYTVGRSSLERKTVIVDTKYGKISMKGAYLKGKLVKYSPEYEDCKTLADKNRIPLQTVYNEALRAMEE